MARVSCPHYLELLHDTVLHTYIHTAVTDTKERNG